jgi:hypothetical protein
MIGIAIAVTKSARKPDPIIEKTAFLVVNGSFDERSQPNVPKHVLVESTASKNRPATSTIGRES